jgi:hypothetical protein
MRILLFLLHYNLGNPTYMGPRHRRVTENDGLLEKVVTNLLSCTVKHRSFRIDYHLTEFIIIYLFILHTKICSLVQYLGLHFTAFLRG